MSKRDVRKERNNRLEKLKGQAGNKRTPATLCAPLSHPLRARILEVLNEEPLSPIGFVHSGMAPGFASQQHALSQVSYHFNQLEKDGCIELAETVQRRGATEHIFKGNGYDLAKQSKKKLSRRRQAALLRSSLQGLMARIVGAVGQGTFGRGVGFHMEWQVVELDEKGWTETRESLERCSVEQRQIWEKSKKRLDRRSADQPTEGTLALLAFESPDYAGLLQTSDSDVDRKKLIL